MHTSCILRAVLLTLVINVIQITAECPESETYPYDVFLDTDKTVHFTWSVDYQSEVVKMRVCAESGVYQWFGVGFSDYGELTNADFVVFWTGKSGVHHFQVCFLEFVLVRLNISFLPS